MTRTRTTSQWRLLRSSVLVLLAVALLVAMIHRLRHHHNLVVITPTKYSECLGPNVVAHIQWDLRGTASGQFVFISAYRLGMKPTVVATGALVGKVDTGEWVTDGTTLMLSDDKNHLLAKRTIETTDCPTSPIWVDGA
ncbi:hypothetical protein [Rhodanobacter sp. BL-MT-08]